MARYDKYDPKVGGFRAFLAVDWLKADLNKVVPVGLDVNGHVVKGPGQTGILGVLVLTRVILAADEPVDVMTDGEIVEFPTAAAPAAPGTVIYGAGVGVSGTVDGVTVVEYEVGARADVVPGALGTPPAADTRSVRIGHTVEARAGYGARLVVRVTPNFSASTGS